MQTTLKNVKFIMLPTGNQMNITAMLKRRWFVFLISSGAIFQVSATELMLIEAIDLNFHATISLAL